MKLKNVKKQLKRYVELHKETGVGFIKFIRIRAMSKYRIYDMLSQPTDKQILYGAAKLMSERMGIPYKKAVKRIKSIHNRTKIPYDYLIGRGIHRLTDEQIDRSLEFYKPHPLKDYIELYAEKNNLTREEVQKKYDAIYRISGLSPYLVYARKYFDLPLETVKEKIKKRDKKEKKQIQEYADLLGINLFEYMKLEKLDCAVLGEWPPDYRALGLYALSHEDKKSYFTHGDKHFLMRKYNSHPDNRFISKKDFFNEKFAEFLGRSSIVCSENTSIDEFTRFIDSNNYKKIIVKPLSNNSGKGIINFLINNNISEVFESIQNHIAEYGNVIVENFIVQHPHMCKIGGGCVNTIRTVTILENDNVDIIYACVRIGKDEVVDNFGAGGFVTHLDEETGIIITNGYDKSGNKYEYDPTTGQKLIGFQVPCWEEARAMVIKAAKKLPNIGCLGWDIAISEEGPLLIEANHDLKLNLIEYTHPDVHRGNRYRAEKYFE